MGIRTKGEEVSHLIRLASIWIIVISICAIIYDEPSFGTHQKEYSISTEEELRQFCEAVNRLEIVPLNSTYSDLEDVTFVLENDIRLSDKWVPIGIDNSSCFKGTFDGNYHTITNMKIDDFYDNSGLFGYMDGTVCNLTIEGYNHANNENCGGLIGTLSSDGYVNNCVSSVNVKGKSKVGGIVGNNEGGHIEQCTNKGKIQGTHKVGGVVGENRGGLIYHCGNTGNINSTRRGVATYGTGGVAGRSVSSDSIISQSFNLGDIISNTEGTGGIVGYVNGSNSIINNSYNKGHITISLKTSDNEITGAYSGGIVGIVGSSGVKITGCYNSGKIKNADKSGNIIGKHININKDDLKEIYLSNNYFRWQIATDNYLDNDFRLIKTSYTYGDKLIEFLSPDIITTKAFVLYMEAQDKLKLQKEDR